MRRSMFRLFLPVIVAAFALLALMAGLQPARAQTGSFGGNSTLIWPISGSAAPDTASISSPFGPRWQASKHQYDYHPGIDIAAPQNTPIHVITDGVVSKVGWLSTSSGLTVIVYHPTLDLYSAYLHLNSAAVAVDDVVSQGQVIGAVGNTGTTEFMHLHFEIRLNDHSGYPASTRNPLDYLPHPDVTTPTIRIDRLTVDPVYSPTVSVVITAARTELDVNTITLTLHNQSDGAVLDQRVIDFNHRIPTGDDSLTLGGLQIRPAHFRTTTLEYQLGITVTDWRGADAFTLTAQVADLAGHTATAIGVGDDTTPPAPVQNLSAIRQSDGSVLLRWTASGDSDMTGTAAQVDVRYATQPLNSFVWEGATPLSGTLSVVPLPAGQTQSVVVPGPLPEPVYFGLKTGDAEGNWSLLSNSAGAAVSRQVFLPLIIK